MASSEAKAQAFVVSPGIQAGSTQKTVAGALTIKFPKPFTGNPVVLVSPYWALQSSPVGSIETVVAVTGENFTVSSGNAAPQNYFVNWVAYGNMG
jgi:hypothetical protein